MSDRTCSLTYEYAHCLVQKARGLARQHRCADCGQRATQWSYDHTDPAGLVSPTGLRYSADVSCYQPRCIPCHRIFDRKHRTAELQAIAGPIRNAVKHAIAERGKARRHGDRNAEDHWDDELERLMLPLASISDRSLV